MSAAATNVYADAHKPDFSDDDTAALAATFVGVVVAVVGFLAALVFEFIRGFLRAADSYEQRH